MRLITHHFGECGDTTGSVADSGNEPDETAVSSQTTLDDPVKSYRKDQ